MTKMSRSSKCEEFCTSKADLKSALEMMCYYGFAEKITNNDVTSAVARSDMTFIFEYLDADKESVKMTFSHLWIREYSDTLTIDGSKYSAELLLNEFGGVWFSLLYK